MVDLKNITKLHCKPLTEHSQKYESVKIDIFYVFHIFRCSIWRSFHHLDTTWHHCTYICAKNPFIRENWPYTKWISSHGSTLSCSTSFNLKIKGAKRIILNCTASALNQMQPLFRYIENHGCWLSEYNRQQRWFLYLRVDEGIDSLWGWTIELQQWMVSFCRRDPSQTWGALANIYGYAIGWA